MPLNILNNLTLSLTMTPERPLIVLHRTIWSHICVLCAISSLQANIIWSFTEKVTIKIFIRVPNVIDVFHFRAPWFSIWIFMQASTSAWSVANVVTVIILWLNTGKVIQKRNWLNAVFLPNSIIETLPAKNHICSLRKVWAKPATCHSIKSVWSAVRNHITLAERRTHVDTVQTVLYFLDNWDNICWHHTVKVLCWYVTFVRIVSAIVQLYGALTGILILRFEAMPVYVEKFYWKRNTVNCFSYTWKHSVLICIINMNEGFLMKTKILCKWASHTYLISVTKIGCSFYLNNNSNSDWN